MYWVMLQTGPCAWTVLGTYKNLRPHAIRKAEAHRDQGRVVIAYGQPYGEKVYDTATFTDACASVLDD